MAAISSGPVVLVTGGAAGVGRVIAEAFLDEGASVHICDISAHHVESFLASNEHASATLCDVGESAQVENVFSELVDRYGRLDVLINNAGIAGPTAPAEDISSADWDRCIAVNVSGTFYFASKAIPLLKKRRQGCIINLSSTAGLMGCPNRSPYVASKWGIVGLTKSWAMELGTHNIRVNAICPTCVEGERIDRVIDMDAANRGVTPGEIRKIYQQQTSMRTFVTAEDVAHMALFLASDKASRISGQIIGVDGNTETLANGLDPA